MWQVGVDFGAALTVALAYIGDRLGIFKAMANASPMTSPQLSERTLYARMGRDNGAVRIHRL